MKVATYLRVSTADQAEKQTIDNQRHAINEFCAGRGYEVVAEFADEEVSGATPFEERPKGKQLLVAAADGLFERVVVYCADRLARDVMEAGLALREFKRLKLVAEFVIQSFDDSPEGVLQFHVLMAIAEYERRVIARRTHSGRERNVRNGGYIAGPKAPYGYRKTETKTLEIDPTTAPIVQQMFEWIVKDDWGLKRICGELDRLGISPPGHHSRKHAGWRYVTVRDFLTHSRYKGMNVYGKAKIPMRCPVIVDEATWEAAGEALARHRRNSFRNTGRVYLLQHILYCRACGSRYFGFGSQRGDLKCYPGEVNGEARFYKCRNRTLNGKNAGHDEVKWSSRAHELEVPIKRWVLELLADPEYAMRQAEIYMERSEEINAEQRRARATTKDSLESLSQRELRAVRLATQNLINEEQLATQLHEVRREREALEANLAALTVPADEIDMVELVEDIFDDEHAEQLLWWNLRTGRKRGAHVEIKPEHIEEALTNPQREVDPEQWKIIIKKLINRIWVEADGSVTIEGVLGSNATSPLITSSTPSSTSSSGSPSGSST